MPFYNGVVYKIKTTQIPGEFLYINKETASTTLKILALKLRKAVRLAY